MKKQIWEIDGKNFLINEESLDREILVGPSSYAIYDIEPLDVDIVQLTKEIVEMVKADKEKDTYDETKIDYSYDGIVRFLRRKGFTDFDVRFSPEALESDDILMFDHVNKYFYNLKERDECDVYRWYPDSTYKTEISEGTYITKLEVSDDSYNLDRWDGSNYRTGGQFEHEKVYKVFTIDDKQVKEDMFLLNHWTQLMGDHGTGTILTKEELQEHLEDYGYNVTDCMYEIAQL